MSTSSDGDADCLSEEAIVSIGSVLNDPSLPLKLRFRALFLLRNCGTNSSIAEIARCFSDPSALLKHELAYCLGQMRNPTAVPILMRVLANEDEDSMVRHEAGEALGALAAVDALPLLEAMRDDACAEIAETCQLAVQRIHWTRESPHPAFLTPYNSIDPAPARESRDINELQEVLVNRERTLWERYRAMFALRNIGDDHAVRALASGIPLALFPMISHSHSPLVSGLSCEDSALFRHEIAYVLGQLQCDAAFSQLRARLEMPSEHGMVRHECAEALGSIATPEARAVLEKYRNDPAVVVRESCEVALDMADYENSEHFHDVLSV